MKKKQVIIDYDEYQALIKENEDLKCGELVFIVKYENTIDTYYGRTISKFKFPFWTVIKGNEEVFKFLEEKNKELDEIRHIYYNNYKCSRCGNHVVRTEKEIESDVTIQEVKSKYSNSFIEFIKKLNLRLKK